MSDELADAIATTPSEHNGSPVSRRLILGGGAALGVGLTGLGVPAAAARPRASEGRGGRGFGGSSMRSGLRFLQGVTDAYRSSGMRLAQSYYDESGLRDTAFVYDNALTLIALLAGGDVTRARAIGDALVYAQTHDEAFNDGRLRQAYHADSFVNPNGTAHFMWEDFGFVGTAVGDMSWAGIALTQLARRTGRAGTSYRTAAVRIGQWIVDKTYSTTGLGGYTFGETAGLQNHKSAEHNIDVYAYFRMLAQLTGDNVWRSRAQHAWDFVEKLWNADARFFYTGSDDGSSVNKLKTQLPLDVQTWSWLAARQSRYAEALDWAATNLAVTDTPQRANSELTGHYKVSGVAFSSGSLQADTETPIPYHGNPDTGAVWFEGTGQLALALRDRHRGRDEDAAEELLSQIRSAQRELGRGQTFNGKAIAGGIVAASSPMHTGFGFGYYQHLHVGATSWYLMAGSRSNPYRFL